MTSAQSTVASSLGLTFSGVNTGNHNMLSMDQQDNAAVSKRDGIAGSNKFHFPRLISLGQAIISLYRRKALRYGMDGNHTEQSFTQIEHRARVVGREGLVILIPVFTREYLLSSHWVPVFFPTYSRLPITRALANSNPNRFPLDFLHTFTVILPSVTRTLNNSHLLLTRRKFLFSLRSFPYTFTLGPSFENSEEKTVYYRLKHNFEFPIDVL